MSGSVVCSHLVELPLKSPCNISRCLRHHCASTFPTSHLPLSRSCYRHLPNGQRSVLTVCRILPWRWNRQHSEKPLLHLLVPPSGLSQTVMYSRAPSSPNPSGRCRPSSHRSLGASKTWQRLQPCLKTRIYASSRSLAQAASARPAWPCK